MKVFVIEDNPVYNDYVCNLLKKDSFDTMSAYNLATAKKLLAKSEVDDIVVADLRLPDGESIELLRWMRANDKQQVFIVMTNYGEVHTAVESMKLGSKDYIQKQLLEDKLIPLIRTLQKEHEKRLQWNIPIFVRQGEAYQKIKKRVRLVATTRMSVLILGENGTGKEHIAQHIHQQSKLADKPFVAVDCGALSPSLIQSAFFGHVKGAFTGAEANKTGYFLEADGGTLFLDEVGELPLPVQGAFLRALELRRFRPVGEVREVESDFRLVAATNRDLDDMVGMDLYRSDLRFRLRGMTIHVPPLRRRAEDIPLLAEHFTARYCQRHELPNKELTPDCYAMLADYSWPGNVRELRHTIERACAAAGDGTQLFTRHLPTEIRIELARKRLVHLSEPEESAPTAPLPEQEPSTQPRKPETFPTLRDMKAKAERDYIAGLFAACQGDVRRAAGIAGVSRGHFYELLKKYGLDRTSSIPEFPAI